MPLPSSLVVKNGSKIRVARRGVHARAGVGHGEHHVRARRRRRGESPRRRRRAPRSPSRWSACPPSASRRARSRRGSSGPARPARDRRSPSRGSVALDDGQLHVLADEAPQHLRATPPTTAFRSRILRLEDLLPAEREELARQVRGALARPPAISSRSSRIGSPGLRSASEHLAVAEDDRQEVVEVVRDAAGEVPDRLHLLRLAELLLHPVALGHVQRDGEPARPAVERRTCGP